jgi:hypothetical protein
VAPTPDDVRTPAWGLGEVGAGILIGFVSWAVGSAIVLSATGHVQGEQLSLTEATLLELFLWVGYVGVPLWVARGVGLRQTFGLVQRWFDLPGGLALGVACQLALGVLYWPVTELLHVDVSKQAQEVVDRAHGSGIAVLVVSVVFGAPFVEELFFRGLMYGALDRRWNALVAVVGASATWAVLHLEPVQFAGLFLFGLVLGELVRRTGRLGPSMWTHVGFNAMTVGWLLLKR